MRLHAKSAAAANSADGERTDAFLSASTLTREAQYSEEKKFSNRNLGGREAGLPGGGEIRS
jgi:hypothetical protein